MPTDYRLGLNNGDGVQHRREQPIEPDEEQSVGHRQFGLRGDASAQHVQLMPQHHNLRFQPRPRLERRDQDMQGEAQKRDHGGSAYSIPPLTSVDGVFGMDRSFRGSGHCRWLGECPGQAASVFRQEPLSALLVFVCARPILR